MSGCEKPFVDTQAAPSFEPSRPAQPRHGTSARRGLVMQDTFHAGTIDAMQNEMAPFHIDSQTTNPVVAIKRIW